MNELTIGDKTYISSKRAAEITGYAKDYVGQLCREGHVEAKMVGRSWYVLESSIRAHRFGAPKANEGAVEGSEEATDAESEDRDEEKDEPLQTWEQPRYTAEVPEPMPKVEGRNNIAQNIAMSESDSAITDMQTAWKEWFEQKRSKVEEEPQEVEEQEEEEEIEEAEEEETDAIPVPVHRVREPEPQAVQAERVFSDIRPIEPHRPVTPPVYAEVPVESQRAQYAAPRRAKEKGSLVANSVLIVVALIVISIGAVGTGFAGKYVSDNAIIRYIEGTSLINKQ